MFNLLEIIYFYFYKSDKKLHTMIVFLEIMLIAKKESKLAKTDSREIVASCRVSDGSSRKDVITEIIFVVKIFLKLEME